MLKDKLGIDEKDVKLLSTLMHNPTTSQQELAELLHLSQPSINVRIRKLKERGVLVEAAGLDAKRAGVALARIDFTCSDANTLLDGLKNCSFFVNGFVMSGTRNVSVFLVGEDLQKVEQIVTVYLRNNQKVTNIEVSVVVHTAKEFICSIDLEHEHLGQCKDVTSCKGCKIIHDIKQ